MSLNQQDFSAVLQNLHDGLYLTDEDRNIVFWNRAAELITGYSAEEIIGKCCADNLLCHIDANGTNLCEGACPLARVINSGQPEEKEIFLHHKNGHRLPVSVRVTPRYNTAGEIVGGIELFSDISHREATRLRIQELQNLVMLDHLTKMPNRAFLEREINHRLEEQRRTRLSFGILFIDIDHFKRINDNHGHDVGDDVIKLIATTLLTNARPFDVFGRWGGEEFVGVIRSIDKQQLEEMASRLKALIENSFIIRAGQRIQVTASVGATMALHRDTPTSLLKRADELLYQSKANGRNCITVD